MTIRQVSPVSVAVVAASGFILSLIMLVASIAGSYALTLSTINHNRIAEQRQAQQSERKLCTTLDHLALLRPPVVDGNAQSNPSRAYLQQLHSTLAQLKPDIGCK